MSNTNFLKTIIESDFLIINKKAKGVVIKTTDSLKYNNYTILNLLETNRNLKQFLRILQFLKKQNNYSLNILIEEDQMRSLFQDYFNKHLKDNNINIINKISSLKGKEKINLLIVFEDLIYNETKKNLIIEKLISRNCFLVVKLNCETELKTLGYYKIYNEMSDIKKIIFIFSIILKVFNSK